MHEQVRPEELDSTLPEHCRGPEDIVAPRAGALLGQVVKIKFKITREFLGVDDELAVRPRGNSYVNRKTDCRRHNEAVVIVGVFTNQVDASRSTEDPWALIKQFPKRGLKRCNFHEVQQTHEFERAKPAFRRL